MEIERKFVIDLDIFDFDKYYKRDNPDAIKSKLYISQYYIPALDGTFRLRRTCKDDHSFSFVIALKKFVEKGKNEEIEVHIDSNTAYEMINGIKDLTSLRKIRYKVEINSKLWDIDFFENGMCLGEVELDDVNEEFEKPRFVKEEVTGDYRFSNEAIAKDLAPPTIADIGKSFWTEYGKMSKV